MNQGLPSFVFVPCQKQTIRNMCIMFIEVDETRIFQTKTKTNFTVCLQLVKPEEFLMRSSGTLVDKFEKRVKLKCQKIMQMEQEGIAEKTKDRARESLHKGFRENYNKSKDRASTVQPNNRATYPSQLKDGYSRRNQTETDKNRLNRPPQETVEDMDVNGLSTLGMVNVDNMSVLDIMDMSKNRRLNNKASIFSTVFLQKEDEADSCLLPDVEPGTLKMQQEATLMRFASLKKKKRTSLDANNLDEELEEEEEDHVEYEEDHLISDNSKAQKARIKKRSIYRNHYTWDLINYMVKSGDDVRQEQFAMQLIFEFNNIFAKKKLKLKLTPYEIIPIGPEGCLVEMVKDATSIDSLKKVSSNPVILNCEGPAGKVQPKDFTS